MTIPFHALSIFQEVPPIPLCSVHPLTVYAKPPHHAPTSSIEVSKPLEYQVIALLIIFVILLLYCLIRSISHRSKLEDKIRSQERSISETRSKDQDFYLKVVHHCQNLARSLRVQPESISSDTIFPMLSEYCSDVDNLVKENLSSHSAFEKIASENQSLQSTIEHLETDVSKLQDTLKQLSMIKDNPFHDYVKTTPAFTALYTHNTWDTVARINSALNSNFSMQLSVSPSAQIQSDSGNTYTTTLYSCTCPDFQSRKSPCKHMFYLALYSGFLSSTDIPSLDKIAVSLSELCDTHKRLQSVRRGILKLQNEKSQKYPWLAQLYADLFYTYDKRIAKEMCERKRPALRAADNVKRLSAELREMRSQCKQYEYQLHYLETLFPWLPDFYSAPPTKVYDSITNSDSEENRNSYAAYSDWLSPEEFSRLGDSEKFQLALERYFKKPKSNWEVGRDYERYIGYLCEMDGYYVHYTGATQKLEDMGRDLLLERGRQLIVVQCKRWSEKKTIHENHIFQLFGSAIELSMKYPDKTVIPVFVTTTICSEVARMCAKKLDVRLYENVPMKPYPCIKCNIGNNGEKIYHLPFDQQYDRVMLRAKDGDRYASTTKEAEQMGFRHAYRWHGTT